MIRKRNPSHPPIAVCVPSPSPKVSLCPVESIMASLAARLQRVQAAVEQPLPDLSQYSLQQMDAFQIDFGKAHLGQTYLEVWQQDQQWVSWFVSHFQRSPKTTHRMFLHYVNLQVERAEVEGSLVELTQNIEMPDQGQSQGSIDYTGSGHPHRGSRMGHGSGGVHVGSHRRLCGPTRHSASGIANVEHGECSDPSHRPPGEDHGQHGCSSPLQDQVRDARSEWSTLLSAGDICGDEEACVVDSEERNREGRQFKHMLKKIQHEFSETQQEFLTQDPKHCHLFEVFCGPQSQLTHQAQQLGFRSVRFGYAQCDLQTSEGRKMLFRELLIKKPDNVWFSPTCGPWSSWSDLNGNKSVQAWDLLHEERYRYVEQIALGVILLKISTISESTLPLGATSKFTDVSFAISFGSFLLPFGC